MPMLKYTFLSCHDCVQMVANGSTHGASQPNQIDEDHAEQMNVMLGDIDCHLVAGTERDEQGFMSTPCETCGSLLAGDRAYLYGYV